MYMSYCRFEGTNHELNACLSEVEDHIYKEDCYSVSEHEIAEFETMVRKFFSFMYDNDLLNYADEYQCELDENKLAEIMESMRLSFAEDDEDDDLSEDDEYLF